MLTEDEFREVEVHLSSVMYDVGHYRQEHGCSLQEAMPAAGQSALSTYERLTGFRETNYKALHHHRISLYGPDCSACGKPLRTARASFCAACGAVRDKD